MYRTLSRRMPRLWLLFALLVATGAGGVAPASASAPLAQLNWTPCADVPDSQCAGLPVPLDPDRPAGPQITLRLARVPTANPSSGKPSLLLIPGGPGAGVAETFGTQRAEYHVDEMRQDRDVYTFDPRGVGESSPVRCPTEAVPSPPPLGVGSRAAFDELAAANAALARSCFAATGELVAHLSSWDSAADIERIRLAIGQDDGLVAYGGSYGSTYLEAYLERYGDRVRAAALDGVVDHSADLRVFAALAVEDAFNQFAAWCDADPGCALHGQDVRAVLDVAVAARPEVLFFVGRLMNLGREKGWPAVARTLAQVATGDDSALAATGPVDPNQAAGSTGLFRGVLCADFGPQLDYEGLAADTALLAAVAPRFGAWQYWDTVGACVGWPAAASYPPHRLQVGSHPNVLVANNTRDPATPLVGALAVQAQIPDSHLLIVHADGHQAWAWSRCGFEAQLGFLDEPSAAPAFGVCLN
jgi:pimeloyl-ACP methyl ester carboxylesterase